VYRLTSRISKPSLNFCIRLTCFSELSPLRPVSSSICSSLVEASLKPATRAVTCSAKSESVTTARTTTTALKGTKAVNNVISVW